MSESGAVQPSLEGTIDTWPDAPEGGWDRVLLKLSGEAFAGDGDLGVDPDVVQSIARQIAGMIAGDGATATPEQIRDSARHHAASVAWAKYHALYRRLLGAGPAVQPRSPA